MNLVKNIQELQGEIFKALIKEIEDGLNKWKGVPCF